MGTTGNIAWAEGVGAVATEPVEALKAAGYEVATRIPTKEEFNWQLQRLGRAGIRRFATSEELVQATKAGLIGAAAREDVGLVLPTTPGPFNLLYSEVWDVDAGLSERSLCADGEYLWSCVVNGAVCRIRKRSRATGAVVLDQPAGGFLYSLIATTGGSVYGIGDAAGVPQLEAYDRTTLAQSYTIALPAAATARAIATCGRWVVVAAGNLIYLYQDTGAAFVLIDDYNHTAQVNSVAIDGRFVLLGGVTPGGGPPHNQIRVLTFDAISMTLYSSLARPNNPAVYTVAFDGESIAYDGAIDGANYGGYFRSMESALRWQSTVAANHLIFVDGMVVEAHDAAIVWRDPADGVYVRIIPWGAAGDNVLTLAYDYDGLFALGEKDAVNNRIKRFCIQNTPRLYSVVPYTEILSGDYAGPVHAMIRPADQRPR